MGKGSGGDNHAPLYLGELDEHPFGCFGCAGAEVSLPDNGSRDPINMVFNSICVSLHSHCASQRVWSGVGECNIHGSCLDITCVDRETQPMPSVMHWYKRQAKGTSKGTFKGRG
eukprot:Sspe_Gene.44430::Locus_21787_Transcript_1_1_Confidence_1.000_Length_1315::g.44430::m.44430